MRILLTVAAIASGASLFSPARAADVTACDQLASHPFDPAKVAEGVAFDDLDGPAAETACRDAIATAPDEPRFVYQLGRALERQDKLEEAEAQYQAAIKQGYPQAFYGFASYLQNKPGAGDAENRTAAEYYQRAIDAGITNANGDLAYIYEAGLGVEPDLARALQLYKVAAEAGDAWSQNHVGVFYADGQGVPVDDAEALKWYRAAADQGFAPAQYNLGNFYLNGRAVEKDEKEAVRLLSLAAAQDDALSLRQLAQLNADGIGVAANTAEAERLLRRALEIGEGEDLWQAQNQLAWLFARNGTNLEEAAQLGSAALAAAPGEHVDRDNVLDTVAWIHHLEGDDEAARKMLTEAIALDPDFPPYHDRLGDILHSLGLADEARAEWAKALDLEPRTDAEPMDREAVEAKLKGLSVAS